MHRHFQRRLLRLIPRLPLVGELRNLPVLAARRIAAAVYRYVTRRPRSSRRRSLIAVTPLLLLMGLCHLAEKLPHQLLLHLLAHALLLLVCEFKVAESTVRRNMLTLIVALPNRRLLLH